MGEAAQPIASFSGPGGARVEVFDESRPYGYADVFVLRLRVVGRFPGAPEPYERVLEKMGIPGREIERVRGETLHRFQRSALPYLLRSDFPDRLARSRRGPAKVVPFRAAP